MVWGDGLKSYNGSSAFTYDGIGNPLTANPIRYRGYTYDSDTGLYYLQSRYYDPNTGRFLNADDVIFLGATGTVLSANIFTYCENDVVNKVDDNGMFGTPIQWAMAAIGGIVGWYFGDYVARKLGYNSGWKYWAIRSGVIIEGLTKKRRFLYTLI